MVTVRPDWSVTRKGATPPYSNFECLSALLSSSDQHVGWQPLSRFRVTMHAAIALSTFIWPFTRSKVSIELDSAVL